jgi:hypothetical protein
MKLPEIPKRVFPKPNHQDIPKSVVNKASDEPESKLNLTYNLVMGRDSAKD